MSSPKYRLGYPDASLSLPARAGADGSGPDGRHDNADLGGFAGTDGRPPESIPDEPPEHKPGSNAGHGHSASTARYADGIEHSRRVGSPVASSPPIRRRPRLSAILQAQLMLRFGAEPGAFSTSLSRALAVSGRPALSEQSPHCKALHRLTHLFRPQTRRRDHAPGPPFRRDDAALPEEGLAFPRSRSPQLTPSRKLRSQPTGCAFSQPSTAASPAPCASSSARKSASLSCMYPIGLFGVWLVIRPFGAPVLWSRCWLSRTPIPVKRGV